MYNHKSHIDIDDCINSDCEHNCTNTDGSYTCSCYNGYSLDSNGRNCSGITMCMIIIYNTN